jgi:hypothetical protein
MVYNLRFATGTKNNIAYIRQNLGQYPFFNKPAWATTEIFNWPCRDIAYGFPPVGSGVVYNSGPSITDIRGIFGVTGRYKNIRNWVDYLGNPYNNGNGDPTNPFGGPYDIWATGYTYTGSNNTGFPAGIAPCNLQHNPIGGLPNAGLGYGRDYHVHILKFVGPLNDANTNQNYETNSPGNKCGFHGNGVTSAAAVNQCIPAQVPGNPPFPSGDPRYPSGSWVSATNSPDPVTGVIKTYNAICTDFEFEYKIQGYQTSWNSTTNGSPGEVYTTNRGGLTAHSRPLVVGEWMVWETVRECNTKASVVGPNATGHYTSDGILRFYINGTLVLEETDVTWCHNNPPSTAGPYFVSSTRQLLGGYWNPTYGGASSWKTREDFVFHAFEAAWGDPNLIIG